MEQKQISLTLPEQLFAASKEFSEEYGYRSLQEFIIELIRRKVVGENAERYREIEERMKKRVGVKRFDQQEALRYVKGL